jgi:PAS domain-containing protein
MNKDEEVAAAQRDDIRHLYYWLLVCFVAMASSAILLVILLFREINKVKGLLAIAHAAESTASAARTQLGAVIDAVPARIAAHDRTGKVIFRNRFAAEGVEGAVDAASGPAIHGSLDERVFASGDLIPLFEEEQIVGGETSLTWLTTKVPLKAGDGEVAAVVTVSLDITEQKQTQRLNTLLATAVEHAGDVIEITDYHSRFQYVNAAFESMSGYRRDEAIGQTP